MTKIITILIIAAALVVGSIATGTMAYGTGDKNGKPFEALWDAIHDIQAQNDADGDTDSTNELQTLIVREPFKTVTVPAGSSKILAVKCNSDEVLSGGGVKANGAGKANARFIDSGSGLDGLTWVGQVIHTGSAGSASFDLQVIAQCLKLQ